MTNHKILILNLLLVMGISVVQGQNLPGVQLFQKGIEHFESNQYELSIKQLNEAISANPTAFFVPSARLTIAKAAIKTEDLSLAKQELDRVIVEYPDFISLDETRFLLAHLAELNDQLETAANLYERMAKSYALSTYAPEAFFQSAAIYYKIGQTEKVEPLLIQLIRDYPNSTFNIPGQILLIEQLIEESRESEALRQLDILNANQSLTLLQSNTVRYLRAKLFFYQTDYTRANAELNLLKKDGQSIDLDANVSLLNGQIQYKLNNGLQGNLLIENALNNEKISREIRFEAARFIAYKYFESGKYLEALDKARLAKSLSMNKNERANLTVLIARSEFETGINAAWLADSTESLLNNLNDPTLVYHIIVLFEKTKELKSLLIAAEYFSSKFPDHPELPVILLKASNAAQKLQGQRTLALEYLKTASIRISKDVGNDQFLFDLASQYLLLDASEDARRLFLHLYTDYPESRYKSDILPQFIAPLYSVQNRNQKIQQLAMDMVSDRQSPSMYIIIAELMAEEGHSGNQFFPVIKKAISSGPLSRHEADLLARLWLNYSGYTPGLNEIDQLLLLFRENQKIDPPEGLTDARFGALIKASQTINDLSQFLAQIRNMKEGSSKTALLMEAEIRRSELGDALTAIRNLEPLLKTNQDQVLKYEIITQLVLLMVDNNRLKEAYSYLLLLKSSDQNEQKELALRVLLTQSYPMDNQQRWQLLDEYLNYFPYTVHAYSFRKEWIDLSFITNRGTEVNRWANLFEEYPPFTMEREAVFELAIYGMARSIENDYPDRSIRIYRQYIEKFRNGQYLTDTFKRLAILERNRNNYMLAATYLTQANVQSLGSAGSMVEIANMYFENGEYQSALSEYTTLIESNESFPIAQQYEFESRRIISYLRLNETVIASRLLEKFQASRPPDRLLAQVESEFLQALLRNRKFKDVISRAQKVKSRFEESVYFPNLLFAEAKAQEQSGQEAIGIAQYNRILKDYTGHEVTSQVYLSLGNYYLRNDQYDQSILNYKKILESNINHQEEVIQSALSNISISYEKLGFYSQALDATLQYIDRFPNADDIITKKIKQGIFLQKSGQFSRSIVVFSQLSVGSDGPLKAELTYYIGESYFGMGNYEKAINTFASIAEIKNANAEFDWVTNAIYMTGQSYEKLNDQDQAIVYYQKIIDRPGTDLVFKRAAKKEIDRIKSIQTKVENE